MVPRALVATVAVVILSLASPVLAIKPYTLVEDGYTDPLHSLELENTFGFDFHTREDSGFKQFSAEHELEYMMTENFQLRLKGSYFYEDSKENTGLHFDSAGIEGQYYFTNSNTDPLGVSVIVSAEAGEQTLDFAGILILQKDFAHWAVTYNLGLETEIEGVFTDQGSTDTTGTLTNALGATYQLSNTWRLGGEVALESAYHNWSSYEGSSLFAGPVINWVPNDKWWLTAGFDFQLTDTPDEPDYKFTVIFGYFF